jgi:hypothetical protein
VNRRTQNAGYGHITQYAQESHLVDDDSHMVICVQKFASGCLDVESGERKERLRLKIDFAN